MEAPSEPPGNSAASAFEIRFWLDIIALPVLVCAGSPWRPIILAELDCSIYDLL
jgi:hypothetical protein